MSRRMLWPSIGLALLLIVAGLGAFTVYRHFNPSDDGPPHPDSWDKRVAPYAAQVEKLRGLKFKEPVYVDFLSVKEFKAKVQVKDDDLDDDDRAEIEAYEGMLRALGLIDAKVDIFKAFNTNSSGGTLAYYSPEDERIRMRGRQLTPANTATLVHELTHALQDQHFDLEDGLNADDDTRASIFRAVAEGDASRVEKLWVADLPTKKREAVERSQQKLYDQGMKDLRGVPAFVQASTGAPYALGEPLSTLAAAAQGLKGANDLFDDTPTTEEHLLRPFSWLDGKEKAKSVPEVTLTKDEKAVEDADGDFGALGWLFMLSERMPVLTALDAADTWGGDHYRSFTRNDRICVRTHYRGDTAAGTTTMLNALRTWVAGAPDGTASVRAKADYLVFSSCDPKRATKRGSQASVDALTLVATRSALAAQLVSEAGPALSTKAAWCFGDRLIREYSIKQLTSDALPPGFTATAQRISASCLTA
ncbi:hypothetical protein ACLM5J_13405 [Nocardioides sp. Bht2]|uniref:hypothetical protein n=1 Tax=Nocardioides sp. Bht2 TaxID=3392297 RepID=UPI0039B439FC